MTRNEILSFICPPVLPENRQCRRLSIPASREWLGVVNAALLLLSDGGLWEQIADADMTPDECAEVGRLMYVEYITSGEMGECGMTVQSTYQRVLAASSSLGNSVADTAYPLTWNTPLVQDAPIALAEDQTVFTLQPGRWLISAQAQQVTGYGELRLVNDDTDAVMQRGVFIPAGSACLDNAIALMEAANLRIDHYFRSTTTNGRGVSNQYTDSVMHNIVFTWRPLL